MSREASQSAITDAEADAAFAMLARFDHLIVAVSGGPDSMALMVLAAEWRARTSPSLALSVATVDHGLRPQSRSEAEMVSDVAQRLELPHSILTWEGGKPSTGVPEAARDARYRLLDEHARSFAVKGLRVAVVTAHHRDDQAETFAMRLARGAGIDGLAGMRRERPLHAGSSIVLIRPLLEISKARLVATVTARGVAAVDDPTNSDLRFERARVRSRLREFEAAGFSTNAIAISARRLGEARDALSYAEGAFAASLGLSFGNEVFARFDRAAFENGPAFLRQRVIARLIDRYGGDSPAPQLSEIEDLVARMQRDGASAATLGGAMISAGPRFVRVWREAGRLDRSDISIFPGEERVWDRRFLLRRRAADAPKGGILDVAAVTVRPLGKRGHASLLPRLEPMRRPPARAAFALPSFWIGEELVAAPSLAPFSRLGAPPLDPEWLEIVPLAASASY